VTESPSNNELEQYGKTLGVYDHIISLQTFMATLTQIFLAANAAVWLAVLDGKFDLSTVERVTLLTVLAFAAVWLGWLFVGITGAIRLRFVLLEKIGDKYFPNIMELGKASFDEAYGGILSLGKASWGKSRWFWFVTPAVSLLANAWLILRELNR